MKVKSNKLSLSIVLMAFGLAIFALAGCKDDTDATTPTNETEKTATEAASSAIEQTICPVMGGKINKNISTEYNGKKVYFCCSGCIKTFEENPEKYLSKLPQLSP